MADSLFVGVPVSEMMEEFTQPFIQNLTENHL